MSGFNNILYQATPLEQAYSLYLAHQVFGMSLPLPNQSGINISGRQAVPFLTQSGVDRTILRSIWSVADPQNFGSLTAIHQLHVILRLVSMAQANGLGTFTTKEGMTQALQQSASQQLPLAFFSNVIMLPPNQLMGAYGHLVVQPANPNNNNNNINTNNTFGNNNINNNNNFNNTNTMMTPSNNNNNAQAMPAPQPLQSVGDAFGSLVEVQDAPLTPLRSSTMPAYNAASSTTPTLSLSDAFAGLGPTENAPLPALGQTPTHTTTTATTSTAAATPNLRIPEPPTNMTMTSNRTTAAATHVPSTPTALRDPPTLARNAGMGSPGFASTTTPKPPSSGAGGGGGGFGFWSLGGGSAMDHAKRINTTKASTPLRNTPSHATSFVGASTPLSTASASLTPNLSMPMPPQAVNVSEDDDSNDDSDDDDDFGDFGSAPVQAAPSSAMPTTTTTNTISSSNNNTMNSGISMGASPMLQQPVVTNFGTNNNSSSSNAMNSGLSMGAAASPMHSPMPQQPIVTDNFGKPSSESMGASASTSNALPAYLSTISDAFGDMGPVQDAPLPSLDAFGSAGGGGPTATAVPTDDNGNDDDEDEDDDDDFGDFEDSGVAPAVTDAPKESSGGGNLVGFGTDYSMFSRGDTNPQQQQQPLASKTSAPQMMSVTENGRSMSIEDAFGDMPIQQDAPLPSLGDMMTMNAAPTAATASTENNNGDDDFGAFEDAAPAPALPESGGSNENESESDDDFGDFGGAETAPATNPSPMPAVGEQQPPSSSGMDMLGFDCGTTSTITNTASLGGAPLEPLSTNAGLGAQDTGIVRSMSIDDAFGDFSAPTDAPLPSLDMIGTTSASSNPPTPARPAQENPDTGHVRSVSIDDAFGDFAAPEDAPLPSLEIMGAGTMSNPPTPARPTVDSGNIDDAFGDFAAPEDAPLPSLEMMGAGTMSNPPSPARPAQQNADAGHVRTTSIDDAFGDFATPEDAPLPSLGMMGGSSSNPPSPARPTQGNIEASNGFGDDSDEDDFGGFSSAPQGGELPTVEQDDDDDEFGDFDAAPTEQAVLPPTQPDIFGSAPDSTADATSMTDTGRTESIADPFGDMPTVDAPLPSLDMLSAPPSNQTKESNALDTANDEDEDEDDFGGFETAPNEADPVPTKSAAPSDDNLLAFDGVTQSIPTQAAKDPLSISDAFGDFEVADAPLPSLNMTESFPNQGTSSTTQDNDLFGDFTSSNETAPAQNVEKGGGGDLLDVFGTETQESIGHAASQNDEGEFGDFGGVEPKGETANNTEEEDDEDDFGDFGSAEIAAPAEQNVQITQSKEVVSQLPASDDFGDFGGAGTKKPAVEDAFGSFEGTGVTSPSNEEDEFGDFGSADIAAPEQQNIQKGAFGDFASSEAAPVKDTNHATQTVEEDLFGDFGSATQTAPVAETNNAAQPAEVDLFGDFGSAEQAAPVAETKNAAQTAEVDLFGDFGSAEQEAPVEDNNHATQPVEADLFGDFGSAQQTAPVQNTDDKAQPAEQDFFGDFGSAQGAEPDPTSQPAEEDDFGDFGSAEITSPPAAQPAEKDDFGDFGSAQQTAAAPIAQPSEEDDFGDFGSAQETTPVEQNADGSTPPSNNAPSGEADFFGAFGSAEAVAPIEQTVEQPSATGGEDEFGDFGSADFPAPAEPSTDTLPPQEEDDFGDFGGADFSSPIPQNDTAAQTESTEEFGDFTVVQASEANETNKDDNFGDFASFQDSSPPPPVQSQEPSDDDDDEWGDFETIDAKSAVKEEVTEEVRMRDRIRSLAVQLPDCVLRKVGVSGDHVDLGESFEINVGTKSSMSKTSRQRAQRCIQVLESLTLTDNSKLASTFWVQIFDVVNEELEHAKSLFTEALSFPTEQWTQLQDPLSVMARGLAEYMRVTRSIVASIGDVLLLDESAMLTVDTWASTWCSLSVLEKALDCEKKWKELQQLLTKTPLGAIDMVSVQEIRSDANKSQRTTDAFCHLTLQPLWEKNKATTKAQVTFQGKCFMACSANFLANRCPFFVVGEEI